MCAHTCKCTQMLLVPFLFRSRLSNLSQRSWQAAWPPWWEWLLSWWYQFIGRGLSAPSSPVLKGSPRLEWDKSTTEEAVLGLAHFCCWLVPCAPPTGLFEQPHLVEQSMIRQKENLVSWKNSHGTEWSLNGGSYEWTFCGDTWTGIQNLTVFNEVNTVISCAVIFPFEALSLEGCVSNIIKRHTAQK